VRVVWQILDTYSPMALRRVMMLVVKWLADVVMCTGHLVAKEHPGAVDFGDKLILFYPPVNLEHFTHSSDRRKCARRMLGLSQEVFVVGNVGNINPQKGHQTFIRAAAELKKKIPKVCFVILGALYENHRGYAEGLWRDAATLGLSKGTDLIVLDPGVDVAKLEQAFDIFWMTSEPRSEGIPTTVEEAMALGIPVIATKVGSISEIIQEGETGYVVEPYDIDGLVERTMRLHSDVILRRSMSGATRDFATQNFSVTSCAQSHHHAYKLALAYNTGQQNDV